MASIRVYGVSPSTFTRAVLLGCHEKGIDYELVPTAPKEIGPINPFGKIPAMTHGDLTLFESAAILRYLDRAFPGPKLWPDDPRAAAIVDQWVAAICDSLLNSAQLYMAARFNRMPVPAEMAARYLARTREILPAFDRQLGKTRFLACDDLSAADLLFAPIFFYFPYVPETKALADASRHCQRWLAEMAKRPSVSATESSFKPTVAS
jgi:glutathione S-transferase